MFERVFATSPVLKGRKKLLEKKIQKKPEDTAKQCRVKALNHKETEKDKC